jgi:hypothetical protein
MKKFKSFLLLFLLPAFVFAGPGPQVKKEQAKRVLRRTAVVILVAHRKVKEGHIYTGNLAKAIAHQKFARKLYREGKYWRAIHQSRRAKFLAVQAIKANKGAESAEMRYSKEDEEVMKGGPSDDALDAELQKEMPGQSMKDEDVIGSEPDVDLTDSE